MRTRRLGRVASCGGALIVAAALAGCGAASAPSAAPAGSAREVGAAPRPAPAREPPAATSPAAGTITQAPADDEGDGEVVGWTTELDAAAPTLVAYFEEKAQSYGCRTVRRRSESLVLRCPEAPMVMLRDGLKVTVGCKGIPLDECRSLFRRISEQD